MKCLVLCRICVLYIYIPYSVNSEYYLWIYYICTPVCRVLCLYLCTSAMYVPVYSVLSIYLREKCTLYVRTCVYSVLCMYLCVQCTMYESVYGILCMYLCTVYYTYTVCCLCTCLYSVLCILYVPVFTVYYECTCVYSELCMYLCVQSSNIEKYGRLLESYSPLGARHAGQTVVPEIYKNI